MTIQLLDPQLIDPNPFQPATRLEFTADDLADLSSIADPAIGLRSVPTVRHHPEGNGRYQRCDGHRRAAAWQLYRPCEPMPNDVQDLTDRQMYDYMAIENGQRQDLTPIEKALIIQGHIKRFGTTQIVAGELVGIRTQGAVSNLIKLLSLPAGVQALVNPQQVPQRIARTLVGPARLDPQAVVKIAQAVAAAADDDKENVAENELSNLLRSKAVVIGWAHFKTDWQPGFIVGQQKTPLSCEACEFFIRNGNFHYCIDKACYTAKRAAWPQAELNRASEKFGIPIAVPADKAKTLNVDFRNESRVKGWLTAKHRPDHLRLVLNPNPQIHMSQNALLDSPHVLLASTDPHALDGPAEKKSSEPTPDRAAESTAQRAKRIAAEEQEAEQRRGERSAARKSRADVTWLMQQVTLDTAAQLKIEGGILEVAAHDISRSTHVSSDWPELLPFEKTIHAHKDDATRKRYIVFKLLLAVVYAFRPNETFSWSRALSKITGVVEGDLKLKLKPGWDNPPISHTDANCWVCGQFTPGPAITGIDRSLGWEQRSNPGSVVTCSPECRKKLNASPASAHPANPSTKSSKQKKP